MATAADKIVIFTGDTLKVSYESLEADPLDANSYNFSKTPYPPDSAFAQVWDVTNQAFLPIGGMTLDLVPLPITQDEATVDDSTITYLLTGAFTAESGSYKLFITAVYPDGQKVTALQVFKVSSRS